MRLACVVLTALVFATSCALLFKSKPADVSWYTPEHIGQPVACRQAAPGRALRLGQVASGSDLYELIVHGDGAYQVGYYEDRRWTERPDRYVRDALARTLFEACGFQRVVEGEAPTLNVQVLAFQEVQTVQAHTAKLALRVTLSRERAFFEETVTISEPVTGPRFEDVVAAMGRALDASSVDVARRVGAALSVKATADAGSQR
jgi:cholesterol transport system auxiliary component